MASPINLRAAMKPVKMAKAPAPKMAATKAAAAPMRFDDAEGKKPNPNGLFNRDGFMDRVPGAAPKITLKPAARTQADIDAAKKAGYKK